jgi:hypothetical protein
MATGAQVKRIPSVDLNLLSVPLISGLIAMRFVAIAGGQTPFRNGPVALLHSLEDGNVVRARDAVLGKNGGL